jgi:hypothetical protein
MKEQVFRLVTAVFALFVAFGITSCETTPVIKKQLSASEKALEAIKKEWAGNIKCKKVDGNFCAVIDNNSSIVSQKLTPVKVGEKYILSGSFKSLGKARSKVYYGFVCYDKNKKQIYTINANVILGSATTLAAACKKGDKKIVIKANKKWKRGRYAIAFNVKDDFSDLPNREIAYKISKVTPEGDDAEIQLSAPLKKAYPAGTKVRMHTSSHGSYVYSAIVGAAIPPKWKSYKGSAALAKPGQMGWRHLRPGTAFLQIVILPNYNMKSDETVAFKDLKLIVK